MACSPNSTVLTGKVYAPNGTDPIPRVRVYVPLSVPLTPYPALYCDQCSTPIDLAWVSDVTMADGSFTLNLDQVPQAAMIPFAIQIGRFRKLTMVPVTCSATPQQVSPVTATYLPGRSADGDIPKIAVSSGPKDHLDAVLAALNITEYDCFEGVPGATHCNKAALGGMNVADLLTNATMLDTYHMAFLSCAPGAYASFTSGNYPQATMTANTASWVSSKYGALFATDTAYDYIAQPFPAPITWQGNAGTVDAANIGCSPPNNTSGPGTNYTVTVDDPVLANWLSVGVHVLPTPTPTPATVNILGFYNPWSVISSLAPTTQLIANGTLPLDMSANTSKCRTGTALTMQNVPLTTQFDVTPCGRVIYSSYHTDVSASATSAQERIMEYLIFSAAYCHAD
jgi:hypothetical protein